MTKIGTLKELNVKPGDVVEHTYSFNRYTVCTKEKHLIHPDGLSLEYPGWYFSEFKVISRASNTQKLWRDMTPEEKGALLLAHHEGKSFEFTRSSMGYKWMIVACRPEWCDGNAYRIKPTRTKSEWSAWLISEADGTTKLNLSECAEVERVALGDSKQFAYRVKKWVE